MRLPGNIRARLGSPDPARVADVLQTVKTALAGTLGWVVATHLLHLEQAFLAPWAAVLVVHSTIHRTLARGAQQVSATFLGVFLAWLAGQLFGLGALAMGAMLLVAFGVGRVRWWRDEAMTIGTTGIVVLATNAIGDANVLAGRLLDTSIGVVVGLAVNLFVWPPLRDRAAWSRLDQLPLDLCEVLDELASGLGPELAPDQAEQWVVRLRAVDVRVDEAWGLVRQARESSRLNPRRSRPAGLEEMDDVLHLLEQAVADVLSMARTVATSAENRTGWDPRFRDGVGSPAHRDLRRGAQPRRRDPPPAARADVRAGRAALRRGVGALSVAGVRRAAGQPPQRRTRARRGDRVGQPDRTVDPSPLALPGAGEAAWESAGGDPPGAGSRFVRGRAGVRPSR